MEIPYELELLGQTILIEYSDSLRFSENVDGWAKYSTNEIILQASTKGAPLPRTQVEHNFFHELVHHILIIAEGDGNEPPLHKREYLVDRIAGLLHQALTTAKYNRKEEKENGSN